MPTFIGTPKKNAINGSNGPDFIDGRAGDDVLNGLNGDDQILGDAGNDVLLGQAGKDLLAGGIGNDALWGGIGDDILQGGEGKDTLFGGAGNDRLEGATGADVLSGDAGEDVLTGGAAKDTLSGGAGNDTFRYVAASDSSLNQPDLIVDFRSGDKIDLTAVSSNLVWSSAPNAANGIWATEKSVSGVPTTLIEVDAVGADGVADMLIRLVATRASTIDGTDFVFPPPQASAPTANPGDGIEAVNAVGHVFTRAEFGFADADGDEFFEITVSAWDGAGKLYYGDTVLDIGNAPVTIPVASLDSGQLVYYREGLSGSGGQGSFEFTVKDDRAEAPNTSSPYRMNIDLTIDRATLFDTATNPDVLAKTNFPGADTEPYSVVFDIDHDDAIDEGDAIYFGALTDVDLDLVVLEAPLIERITDSEMFVLPTYTSLTVSTVDASTYFFREMGDASNPPFERWTTSSQDSSAYSYTYQLFDYNGHPEQANKVQYYGGNVPSPFDQVIGPSAHTKETFEPLLDVYFA